MPSNVFLLLFLVLAPIVPAYVLFRFLPSRAAVTGPFKGLQINLSGGFASYFLIFLALIGIRSTFTDPTYETWRVTGRIVQPDGSSEVNIDPRFVTLSSPSLKSDANGNFDIVFLRTSDSKFDFPTLFVSVPNYMQKLFYLGPKDHNYTNAALPRNVDSKNHVVYVGDVPLSPQTYMPESNPYASGGSPTMPPAPQAAGPAATALQAHAGLQ